MISDVRKWHMRLLLVLAIIYFYAQLFVGYFSNIFFNAEGFLFKPFELLLYIFSYIDEKAFWSIYGIFFLIIFVGPMIWPRIFIWPALIMNLFIFVGSADLLWKNYERAIIFWTNINTGYGKYGWIKEQLFFMFWAALFVALLLPSALRLVKGTR